MPVYNPPSDLLERGRNDPTSSWIDRLKESMDEGVPYDLAEEIRGSLGLSKTEFAIYFLMVNPRTYARFKRTGRLNPAASDRAYRLARLLEAATALHDGDEVRAIRWIKTPNRALGDRRPIDAVRNELDFERAMDLIGALEEGVFV